MRWLANVFIALSLFSFQIRAMEAECDFWTVEELLIRIFAETPPKFKQIFILGQVCKAWQKALQNDAFWKCVYFNKKGTVEKLDEEKTYKQNCLAVLLYHHGALNCELKDYPTSHESENIVQREIITANTMSTPELLQTFAQALDQKPQVISTCFVSWYSQEFKAFLKQALDDDVLFVIPLDTSPGHIIGTEIVTNLHEAYPNLIWASCSRFHVPYNDLLVDILVNNNDGTSGAALILSRLAIYLRSQRPGLTASQIRNLILASATRKFLNAEAAVKMVTEFGLKEDNSELPKNAEQ
jgi:hypothetical protein